MQVAPINSSNSYNHQNLVNNPPYITNYPLLEYLDENKLDLRNNILNASSNKSLNDENKMDRKMNALLLITIAAIATIGYMVFHSIKNFLK